MKFKKFEAKVGDTVKINDALALKYEKVAEDLRPVWQEIPSDGEKFSYEDGTFVSVTSDVWFVYDRGEWRMMTPSEHIEASRQTYLSTQ